MGFSLILSFYTSSAPASSLGLSTFDLFTSDKVTDNYVTLNDNVDAINELNSKALAL